MTSEKLFYHAQLYQPDCDNYQGDSWFTVENGKITNSGVGKPPSVQEAVDLSGKFVLPGLINCHTHVVMDPTDPLGLSKNFTVPYLTKKALDNIQELLETGVTFFRDVGAPLDIDLELKKMIDTGEIFGPDCMVSGTPIVMTGGHGYEMGLESDGTFEVLKHTRQLLKKGVGCIKVMATGGVMTFGETPHDVQLSVEELKVAIGEAHKKNRNTAAHAQGLQGVKNSILAGVDSIEHGVFLDEEAIEMMVERGTYLSPTLVAPYYIVKEGTARGIPSYMVEKSKRMVEAHMVSLEKAIKAGVKIVLGTDAGTPYNLYRNTPFELELLTRCGMSTKQAVQVATLTGAQMLKIDSEFGTLERGKYADFLVLDKDPLVDISELQRRKKVYKKGQLV